MTKMPGEDLIKILEETLEILRDEETLCALRESEEDVRTGRLSPPRDVKRELGLG